MDFFITLGFKLIFDFFCPPTKMTNRENADLEAGFWYGTSFENNEQRYNRPEHSEDTNIDSDSFDW